MTRLAAPLALVLALLALLPPVARAEEPAPQDETWEGYLWRDAAGRVRLGWPVIAMGVMAMPIHGFVEADAKRLAPLAGDAKSDYHFWNYSFAEAKGGVPRGTPRVLVRVVGKVTPMASDSPMQWSGEGERTMSGTRLATVEFLSEEWLSAWGAIFREKASPFWSDGSEEHWTLEQRRKAALKFLEILEAMRAAPGASEEQRALARRIDAEVRVVDTHRKEMEWWLHRWLAATNAEHALAIDGIAALGPVAPAGTEIQRWFLDATTKEEFLARVREAWAGDLEPLTLAYYEDHETPVGSGTTYRSIDLRSFEEKWTQERYQVARAATQRILGR